MLLPVLVTEAYRTPTQFRTGSNCGERFLGVAKKGAVVNTARCSKGVSARSSLAREFWESKIGNAGCGREYSPVRPAKMAFPALKMAVAWLYPPYRGGMRWWALSIKLTQWTHAWEFRESIKRLIWGAGTNIFRASWVEYLPFASLAREFWGPKKKKATLGKGEMPRREPLHGISGSRKRPCWLRTEIISGQTHGVPLHSSENGRSGAKWHCLGWWRRKQFNDSRR